MTAATPADETSDVARAIRDYLARHPLAADTAAGIQRWWLLPEFGEFPLPTVETALAGLEREGVVRRVDQIWASAS